MANVTAGEITEIRRIPINHAQGKQIQILEVEINEHTWANGDNVAASVLPGCANILAVLSCTYKGAGALAGSSGDEYDLIASKRAARDGGSNKPADIGDIIDFPTALTDSINYVHLILLIESDYS